VSDPLARIAHCAQDDSGRKFDCWRIASLTFSLLLSSSSLLLSSFRMTQDDKVYRSIGQHPSKPQFPHLPQYIVLTFNRAHHMLLFVVGALSERLIGNLVKIQGCPAAVSENERRIWH
jgi:hypothetical protein